MGKCRPPGRLGSTAFEVIVRECTVHGIEDDVALDHAVDEHELAKRRAGEPGIVACDHPEAGRRARRRRDDVPSASARARAEYGGSCGSSSNNASSSRVSLTSRAERTEDVSVARSSSSFAICSAVVSAVMAPAVSRPSKFLLADAISESPSRNLGHADGAKTSSLQTSAFS